MRKSEKEIYEKVKAVLAVHPGGEAFFDKLDGEIIDNASDEVMADLFSMVPKGYFVVLSGGFGKKVAQGIDSGKYPKISYFLYAGGIRSGNAPRLIRGRRFGAIGTNGIFLDDSIYGGATYYAIKDHMKTARTSVDTCAVIYDGCPVKKDYVKSLFRYYDHFKGSKPNYEF